MTRRIVIVGLIALTAVFVLAGVALAQEYRCTVTGTDGDATLFRCVEVTPTPTDEPTPEPTPEPTKTPAPPSVAFVLVTGPDANGAGQTLTNGIEVQPGTYSIRVDGVEPPQSIVLDGPIAHRQTENIMPIMLFGDGNGTLNATHLRDFPTGNYTISAADVTIAFSVVAEQEPPTPTPTATPDDDGPVGIPGDPYVGAPVCPDDISVNPDLHKDQRLAHGLWDAERGCHYTHTHNANPDDFSGIFGDYRTFTKTGVGYPWETPMENAMKHPGYKWLLHTGDCTENIAPGICITHARTQLHAIGAGLGMSTRYHSFFAQVRACLNPTDDSTCGIATTGGWNDYGDGVADYPVVMCPYKQAFCAPPEDEGHRLHDEPYIAQHPVERFEFFASRNADLVQGSIWSTTDQGPGRYGYNQRAGMVFVIHDDWGGLWPGDMERNRNDPHIWRADGQSKYNSSRVSLKQIEFYGADRLAATAPQWFTEQGGYVTGNGWTDKEGNLNLSCSATGPDCIPLNLQNFPAVGLAAFNWPGNGYAQSVEYDVSPAGEYWIEYPN